MNFFDALILGILQGVTEFLPVSSSGHLILMREWLSLTPENGLLFDVLLHFATALAVIVYFRKDIIELVQTFFKKTTWQKEVLPEHAKTRILFWGIVLGSVPAAFLGYVFESYIEESLRSPSVVVGSLIAGSLLFILAERLYSGREALSIKKGGVIGLFQSLALIPGFSRSGATISGGLILGMSREQATRFAFLLSLPVLLGAGGLKVLELISVGVSASALVSIFIGAIAAFIVGLGAIHFMIRFLRTHTLWPFVVYRLLLAAVVLSFSL